jgi:hypothetical protein
MGPSLLGTLHDQNPEQYFTDPSEVGEKIA